MKGVLIEGADGDEECGLKDILSGLRGWAEGISRNHRTGLSADDGAARMQVPRKVISVVLASPQLGLIGTPGGTKNWKREFGKTRESNKW